MVKMFSQRMGITKAKTLVQQNVIDEELRTALWNTVYSDLLESWVEGYDESLYDIYEEYINKIWLEFFKGRVDKCPSEKELMDAIEQVIFSGDWFRVYDIIDYIAVTFPVRKQAKRFTKHCNTVLEKELSPYRFVEYHLTPNISEEEIKEVGTALNSTMIYTQHLSRALELLTDRKVPDARNSIKESISAVEATCKLITGSTKATLNDALKKLAIEE